MWDQPETQDVMLPADPLCKWLGHRWETMQELAIALERERRSQIDGEWWGDRNGDHVRAKKAESYIPAESIRRRLQARQEIAREAKPMLVATRTHVRIEAMLDRAFHKKSKRLA